MSTFVLYDDAQATADGARVLLSGLHLQRFRKNPVMLYMHKRAEQPFVEATGSEVIGRWENIRQEGTQLLAEAVFDTKDPLAQKIAGKVADGFLKAASIGIQVHKSSPARADKVAQAGRTITESSLLEVSIVDIPQHEDALAKNYVKLHFDPNSQKVTNMLENTLQKALCKPLGLPKGTEPEALLEAVAQLKSEKEALAATLTQTHAAAATQQIETALKAGAIQKEEAELYQKLFKADRGAATELLSAVLQKHAATQAAEEARRAQVAAAVQGNPAEPATDKATEASDTAKQKTLSETEVRQLQATNPEGYVAYIAGLSADNGLTEPKEK